MKTAHVLFSISLVGASSAFVFTSPLLPSSKNVYQTPFLLEAKEIVNEKERSENGVNAKIYGEIKDILLSNISPEEKAKLIARRIENEQDLTAKVSMQKKSKISAVRDELRKILSISDPLEREDALVDLTVDKEKRAENAENLYREERLLNTNLTRTVESLSKDKIFYRNRYGILLLRSEIDDLEERFKPKKLVKTGVEKTLRNRTVIWLRILTEKENMTDIRVICKHLNATKIEKFDFAETVADIYQYLSNRIHSMIMEPNDSTDMNYKMPKKFVISGQIIDEVFKLSTVKRE